MNMTKGLGIFVILFFVAWTIRATLLFPIDQTFSSPALGQIYADMLRILIWVIPVIVYIASIDKKSPVEYLRLNTFGNKRAVFQSSIVVLFYFVIILFVDFVKAGFSSHLIFAPSLLSNSWLKTILVISVAPIAEEIMFRGFLLQKIQAFWENWKANLVTSTLFAAIHFPNWIYTGKAPFEILTLSVGIFTLSILLGYLMQKTETILPSIVVHMVNNIISFYVSFA